MYDQQISNDFDNESTWTGTTKVTCSWIRKIGEFYLVYTLVYTLASTNINQSTPNFVKIYTTIRP